jgi:fructose-1,6-bisphosphatase
MKIKFLKPLIYLFVLLASCTVTFITGYDQTLDETLNRMKKDFNLHFIKLSRTLQDTDPHNQDYVNFQDYYDNLEADLITIKDRTKFLDSKASIVKKQVLTLDSSFHVFMDIHKRGMPDRMNDDRHDMRDAVNTSIDAVIMLQEALKTKGKID